MPLAVRVSIRNAFGFLDLWSFTHDLFVHTRHESFYAAAVQRFFAVESSEKVVPDSKFNFSLFQVEFYDFYFSQTSIRESLADCFQEKLFVNLCYVRCFFDETFACCFACLEDYDFGA